MFPHVGAARLQLIAIEIRLARKMAGLSEAEFASAIETSTDEVTTIERGETAAAQKAPERTWDARK